MGKRPDPVDYASASTEVPRSHAATRYIPVQTCPADTEVSSAAEGEAIVTMLLFLNVQF